MNESLMMYLTLGSLGLSVITIIILVIYMIRFHKLYRRYDLFMRGRDAESMEGIILLQMDEIRDIKAEDKVTKEMLRQIRKGVRLSYQKFGMVKYNAFKGMGGNLSFAMSLLNEMNSGIVLNAVHTREGCYLYIKEVEQGETEVLLGSEEQEALEIALGYHDKFK